MDHDHSLEPRLRFADARVNAWGLFSPVENSWLDLTFATRRAAEEAAPVLAQAATL